MKNLYLFILFLLISIKGLAQQGVDVIFMIDNSDSMSDLEFTQVKNTIQSLSTNIINCNPTNKICIVHEDRLPVDGAIMYIESDFTNDLAVINNFGRRYRGNGSVFNGISNLHGPLVHNTYLSVHGTPWLNRTLGNNLVLYIFTDAGRNGDLVSLNFEGYTNFKKWYNAKIMMAHVPPSNVDLQAAAGITSKGGKYNGIVESYSTDPDGAGTTPRYLTNKTDFAFTPAEIESVSSDICSVRYFCEPSFSFISPKDDVILNTTIHKKASGTITASNVIKNGGIAQYISASVVFLENGFDAVEGATFLSFIEECSNPCVICPMPNPGISKMVNLSDGKLNMFPNPSTDVTTFSLVDGLIRNITITSMEGFAMYKSEVMNSLHEINVSNFKKGIYIVTVETTNGDVYIEKLMKN